MMKRNISQTLDELRSGAISPKKFMRYEHVTKDLIKRLKLDKELNGHNGCVNCIEWNETGEFLASGSDDTHVIIWDPFSYSIRSNIQTNHSGNIFSVKFMPKFNNTKLASAAADFVVKTIDITSETVIEDYKVHNGRVKRLAVCDNEPNLLWSCSEDGTICQFDIRENNQRQSERSYNNVLINLKVHYKSEAEAKCLAINPIRPYQIAVGGNDPYVRLFDRRKLKITSQTQNFDYSRRSDSRRHSNTSNGTNGETHILLPQLDAVQYYAPGHVRLAPQSNPNDGNINPMLKTHLSATYLTFSPDGESLLVNMGSEQIYLYDISRPNTSFCYPNSSLYKRISQYINNVDSEELATSSINSTNFSPGSNSFLCDYQNKPNCTHKRHREINNGRYFSNNNISKSGSNYSDLSESEYIQKELPDHLSYLKDIGNTKYQEKDYMSAVYNYNVGLEQGGHHYARFFANRATAYMARNWTGDMYAALLDSIKALEIEPDHMKSHFRVAQCMNNLGLIAEAYDYLLFMKHAYPEEASQIQQIKDLDKRITDRIQDSIVKWDKSKPRASNGTTNGTRETDLQSIISRYSKTRIIEEQKSFSPEENEWRNQAADYHHRYCGHCNTTTDIKEANFFGMDGRFIMAGSDDGNIFFWERDTENMVRVFCGDTSIVNCLQPHPSICFLASSGIDNVVRLWSPFYDTDGDLRCEETTKDNRSRSSDNYIMEYGDDDDEPDHDSEEVGGTGGRGSDVGNEDNHTTRFFLRRNRRMGHDNNVIGVERDKIQTAQENQHRLRVDPFEMVLVNMGIPSFLNQQTDDDEDDEDEDVDDDEDDEEDEDEVSEEGNQDQGAGAGAEAGATGSSRRTRSRRERGENQESSGNRRRRGRRQRITLDSMEYCRTS